MKFYVIIEVWVFKYYIKNEGKNYLWDFFVKATKTELHSNSTSAPL